VLSAYILKNQSFKHDEINPPTQQYSIVDNFDYRDMDISKLGYIEGHIDMLIKAAENLKQEEQLFENIGFDIEKIEERFTGKDGVIPFLNKIKELTIQKIKRKEIETHISKEKEEKCKEEFVKYFKEYVNYRDIFVKYLNLYEDRTKEGIYKELKSWDKIILDCKSRLFDKWYKSYSDLGESYGKNFAIIEDIEIERQFFNQVIEKSQDIPKDELIEKLNKQNVDDYFMISVNQDYQMENIGFMEDYKDNDIINSIPYIKIKHQTYSFNNNHIPVFFLLHRDSKEKYILLLNKHKLGKLIQYSPIDKPEDIDYIKDIFYIKFQEFLDASDLMNTYIDNPPDWLKKEGDIKDQKDYLKTLVHIQIFEKYEFKIADDFEGYKVIIQ